MSLTARELHDGVAKRLLDYFQNREIRGIDFGGIEHRTILSALALAASVEEAQSRQGTHWEDCWKDHHDCAKAKIASFAKAVEESGEEIVRELLDQRIAGFNAAMDVRERGAARIVALQAELASVKAHAEAMAVTLDSWARLDGGCKCAALDAYRAAHPKEGT